ncbi:hypothetical protein K3172_12830 [Qipengyuania sp. 6B39]|uniref:hypothetical protein n=1 Tax=Qipengyuania proteolytica TaxID=2867239 RepID=UPI001C8A0BD6|nr:hypothetical protein [Qipengyuania proteolytica]MBX7496743.1 hypothetical protein [Qipengyuania proteolytica]
MSVDYDVAVKTVVQTAKRDYFADGTLEILAANDTVLAIFGLVANGGSVSGDTWTLGLDSSTVTGEAGAGAGTDAAKAQIKTSGGDAHMTGLTAGQASTAWAASTAYTAGQYVNNGGNLYVCASGGTSAGSGGPTGTGTGITDGTVSWDYVSAKPDLGLDNVSIASGQNVTLSTTTIKHA